MKFGTMRAATNKRALCRQPKRHSECRERSSGRFRSAPAATRFAAGGLQQLLLAIGDGQVAVFNPRWPMSPVANQPSERDDSARSVRLLVIAHHHAWPTHKDLAVIGDAHFDVAQRVADGADVVRHDDVVADHGRGFGQPIALRDRQADGGEEFGGKLGGERRARREMNMRMRPPTPARNFL